MNRSGTLSDSQARVRTRSAGGVIFGKGRVREARRANFRLSPSEFLNDCKFTFIYRRWGATEGEQAHRWLAFSASTTQTVAGPDYTFPATYNHVPTLQLCTNLSRRQFLEHPFCKFFADTTLVLSVCSTPGLMLSYGSIAYIILTTCEWGKFMYGYFDFSDEDDFRLQILRVGRNLIIV